MADRFVRVNERIRAREIRVVTEQGQLGIMSPHEALKIAREQHLDLVEISPTATPPVCKIMDYGKFLYQESKRQSEARKKQHHVVVKEVKFRPNVNEHDYDFKKNHVIRFLKEGDKVKATIMFRGREITHSDIGRRILERLIQDVAELGQLESRTRMEGNTMNVILAPKKVEAKPEKHEKAEKHDKPAKQSSGQQGGPQGPQRSTPPQSSTPPTAAQ